MSKAEKILCLALLGTVSLFQGGCASVGAGGPGYSSPMGQGPISETHALNGYAASKDLDTARRMIKGGQYSLVIPRLQQLVNQYPGDKAGIEARYLLALSYYHVGGYNDAKRIFEEYISLVPEGEQADKSREYLGKITATDGSKEADSAEEQKIEALRAQIAAAPDNMALWLDLANIYWNLGRYDESGAVYRELLGRWPDLMNDTVVRTRVSREADGTIVTLSPRETERRYYEQEPLQIFNISSFRSGRFENWSASARERYYNVTGQAVNRGEKTLEDVRITVTIYGFGQMVYDTQTVALGTLKPGEVRAFNVHFTQFDDINNVRKHECVGTFRR